MSVARKSCAELMKGNIRTAEAFFAELIGVIDHRKLDRSTYRDPGQSICGWFAVCDPLQIANDPECQYGMPVGCVN